MVEPGQQAPDFELPDQDGRSVKLSDFRGQPVVVYFYPKAATPGCTAQACGVREHHADYAAEGAVVLGVSPDPVAEIKRFHVWVEKSRDGRTFFGNERTTFVIDPDGRVSSVLRRVKPSEHDELVLGALREARPPVA